MAALAPDAVRRWQRLPFLKPGPNDVSGDAKPRAQHVGSFLDGSKCFPTEADRLAAGTAETAWLGCVEAVGTQGPQTLNPEGFARRQQDRVTDAAFKNLDVESIGTTFCEVATFMMHTVAAVSDRLVPVSVNSAWGSEERQTPLMESST